MINWTEYWYGDCNINDAYEMAWSQCNGGHPTLPMLLACSAFVLTITLVILLRGKKE